MGELTRPDGTKAEFTVGDGGTAHIPYFESPAHEDMPDNFYGPERFGSDDNIYIIPYEGHFFVAYVLSAELKSVVEPNGGLICIFNKAVAPTLAVNAAPPLCERFLAKEEFDELPSAPLYGQIPEHEEPGWRETFKRISHLDGGKGDLVISQIDVTMGAGCSYENLAFFSDGQPEQSPRNDALSRA
ncbi:MAG: hypothetical protein ACYCZX_19180, partial [Rhodospirillaceae bacterium]